MNNKLKTLLNRITIFLILLLSSHGVVAKQPNPGVLSPQSKPYGMTYGEWSAAWWKWVYSIPAATNPLNDALPSPANDEDCTNGEVGQFGPVWFLGGAWAAVEVNPGEYVGKAIRNCSVPHDKALFFPIINAECSTIEGNGNNYGQLLTCAKKLINLATEFSATIDDVPIVDLTKYREKSPIFTYGPLPDGNLLQDSYPDTASPGATSLAAADGYYLMLAPLSVGTHTIKFTANVPAYSFSVDITYNLQVE
jgi:hypothetical protein